MNNNNNTYNNNEQIYNYNDDDEQQQQQQQQRRQRQYAEQQQQQQEDLEVVYDNYNNSNNNIEQQQQQEEEEYDHDHVVVGHGDGPRITDWDPHGKRYRRSMFFDRPRRYIYDRVRGASRYHGQYHKPPCCICYVPFPVYTLSTCFEQNPLCDCVGKIGCINPEETIIRRKLFTVGFIINTVACVILMFASFTTASKQYSLLEMVPFTVGTATTTITTTTTTTTSSTLEDAAVAKNAINETIMTSSTTNPLYVGMKAITYKDTESGEHIMKKYHSICDALDSSTDNEEEDDEENEGATIPLLLQGIFMQGGGGSNNKDDECTQCVDVNERLVRTSILGVVVCLPSIFTNILRMYPNYDVNCQKFYGFILGLLSIIGTLRVIKEHNETCIFNDTYEVNNHNNNDSSSNGNGDTTTTTTVSIEYEWEDGIGKTMLIIGTVIKIVDVLMAAIVPTPQLIRNHKEQEEYEEKYYGGIIISSSSKLQKQKKKTKN